MNISFDTITEKDIDYILINRLNKDTTELDDIKYKTIFLNTPQAFKIIRINGTIVAITGFILGTYGLAGYLILTKDFKTYYKTGTKIGKELVKNIKAPIYFPKHHDINYINRWYAILGFEYDKSLDIWIRRYNND